MAGAYGRRKIPQKLRERFPREVLERTWIKTRGSVLHMATALGLIPSAVTVLLEDYGIAHVQVPEISQGQPSKVLATREELFELYKGGHTLEDIAERYGVTRQAVFYALKPHGIARRSYSESHILALSQGKIKGKTVASLDESLFAEWSPEMAYLLGYIFTDGCLTRAGKQAYRVTISSIDREHLEKLASILGTEVRIAKRIQSKKGFSGVQDRIIHQLEFTRPRMIKDLCRLGLTERKSLILGFPEVPERCLREFVRGCWDGDGSIYVEERDKRLVAKLGMGSRKFISGIRDRLVPLGLGKLTIYVREPHEKQGRKNPHYMLVIFGQYAVKFCEWLYNDTPYALCLRRKRLVYERHIGIVREPVPPSP